MFILEVWLTTKAWRNGWGGRALIPVAVGFGLATLLGVALGASGNSPAFRPAATVIDVALLFVLGTMARQAPSRTGASAPDPKPPPPAQRSGLIEIVEAHGVMTR